MHLNQFVLWLTLVISFLFLSLSVVGQCTLPVNHKIIDIDTNKITLQWNHPGADSFEIEVVLTSNEINSTTYHKAYSNNITISDLKSASSYDYKVRAYCIQGNVSNWSTRIPFVTSIKNNNDNCDLGIKLLDGNCTSGKYQEFKVLVEGYQNKQLGIDINLQEVKLIIDHIWPEDLDIKLSSPNGKTIGLVKYGGIGRKHFGNPEDHNCERSLIFTPLACKTVRESRDSLIGYFLPEENMEAFNDGSSPEGTWTIGICDQTQGDIGTLNHIKLKFDDDACTPPLDYKIIDVRDNSVKVKFSKNVNCSKYWIEVLPENAVPGQKNIAGQTNHVLQSMQCAGDTTTIGGLLPGMNYDIYFRTECDSNTYSDNSCKLPFTTLCHPFSLRSIFDDKALCESSCGENCETDNIWTNKQDQDLNWSVHKGPTPTPETGPNQDVYGQGNYIYVEASDPSCLISNPAELISPCLLVPERREASCDISFHYHQFGISGGTMTFEASIDEGQSWDTLWSSMNLNNPNWQRQELSLENYSNKVVKLRFTGLPGGNFGDLALDEISLHSDLQLQPKDNKYFLDADGDGYGNPNIFILSCLSSPPNGYVNNGNDCDDNDKNINPGNEEIPCNLKDDNCNGMVDDVPGTLEVKNIFITDETCKGAQNGKIEIQLQGGFPPFNVSWNDGNKTLVGNNLKSGFYFVTIQDDLGCLVTIDSIFVGGQETFEINLIEKIPNTCPGQFTGKLQIEGIRGDEPYSYFWSDGEFGPLRTNLKEGAYSVTVQDNIGCEAISTFEIQPLSTPQIQLIEARQPSCPDKLDGIIRVRVSNADSPILYRWNNGDTLSNLRNVGPGIYTVTIQDAAGCSNETSFELTAPPPINLKIIALDPVTCPGGRNGSIYLRSEGGTPPLYYNWNNGLSLEKNLINVPSGAYNVTATDSRNCKAIIDSTIISEPPKYGIDSINIVNNKCLQSNSGSISLQLSGGTGSYAYFWNTGQNTLNLQNLSSGFYKLTITDSQNCKHSFPPFQVQSVQIPLSINLDVLKGNSCFLDEKGIIGVSASDAELPIEFHWTTGKIYLLNAFQDSIKELKSGTYGVTLTDQNGCNGTITNLIVDGPTSPLSYRKLLQESNLCFGNENGTLSLLAEGGKPPYTYHWNNGLLGPVIEQLPSGEYTCMITDSLGCEINTQSYEINSPEAIQIQVSVDDENCLNNGASLEAEISGGKPPYQISWETNNETHSGTMINNIGCGIVYLSIKDANACSKDTFFILGSTSVNPFIDEKSLLFPNPASSKLFYKSEHPLMDENKVIIFTPEGKMYPISKQTVTPFTLLIDIEILPPGLYFLRVNNQSIKRFIKQN